MNAQTIEGEVLGWGWDILSSTNAIAAGDTAFAQMKRAADAAKWPADLTPQVKFLDKSWVDARDKSNDAARKDLTSKMVAITEQLVARFAPSAPPAPAPPAPARGKRPDESGSALDFLKQDVGPLPLYYWLLGAGAAVGGYLYWKKRKAKV